MGNQRCGVWLCADKDGNQPGIVHAKEMLCHGATSRAEKEGISGVRVGLKNNEKRDITTIDI